jgi:parvulin-like peptidyl-prolyl isomerase
MRRIFAVLLVVFFVVGNIFAALEVSDQPVAVVNGTPIFRAYFNGVFLSTIEEYKQTVPVLEQNEQKLNALKDMVLNQEIDFIILKQESKKQKIKVTKKEIKDAISKIKKKFKNEFEFDVELKKENITNLEFERRLADQLAIIKLIKQSVESKIKIPTEIEVKTLYDSVIKKMKKYGSTSLKFEEDVLISDLTNILRRISDEQAKIRQIFIRCPKGADSEQVKVSQIKIAQIKKELKGKTFSEVARTYSEDQTSKARSGDLGLVARIDLPYNVSNSVFTMKIGEYTKEPIRTDLGYHFIKVEERRTKREIAFDDVKNDFAEVLYQNNAKKAYTGYVDGLKSKANIKINKNW